MDLEFFTTDMALSIIREIIEKTSNKELLLSIKNIQVNYRDTKKLNIPNDLIDLINNSFIEDDITIGLKEDINCFFHYLADSDYSEMKSVISHSILKIYAKSVIKNIPLEKREISTDFIKMNKILLESIRFLKYKKVTQNESINDFVYITCLSYNNTDNDTKECLLLKYYTKTEEPIFPGISNDEEFFQKIARKVFVELADGIQNVTKIVKGDSKIDFNLLDSKFKDFIGKIFPKCEDGKENCATEKISEITSSLIKTTETFISLLQGNNKSNDEKKSDEVKEITVIQEIVEYKQEKTDSDKEKIDALVSKYRKMALEIKSA